jgi:two-component system sensor histidine kinase/response regulator
MMGGSIAVQSQPGVGSTFTATFWLGEAAQQIRAPLPVMTERGMHVLVVDDNESARQILSEQLSILGLRPQAVSGGVESLAALRGADLTDPFELVLMDWQMPDMDGIEATRRIVLDQTLTHHPAVVMLTAFGADEARTLGTEAGVSSFLDKPVSQSRLWDALAGIIPPEPLLPSPCRVETVSVGQLANLCVLLVEDNEINQQIARELMESMGAQVTLANNGQQAVDLLQAASDPLPWSVVLMDLQMPHMDGHEATFFLRMQDRFKELPIIALTAHSSATEVARCLAEGMNAHLSKPIDPEALLRCLTTWGKPIPLRKADLAAKSLPAASSQDSLQIRGIDTARGLRLCADNSKLYAEMLDRFTAGIGEFRPKFQDALENTQWEEATRLVHSLRGVAANIGATQCSELSADVEADIGRVSLDGLSVTLAHARVANLITHLVQLEVSLRAALVEADVEKVIDTELGRFSDSHVLSQLCRELSGLLMQSNVEAVPFLRIQSAVLRDGLGEAFSKLQQEVQSFNFPDALNTLTAAAHDAGIKLN